MSQELGLVAHYGAKIPSVEHGLRSIQEFVSGRFSGRYAPRESLQVHATIVYLGKADEVDPEAVRRLAREWRSTFKRSLDIQFGGMVMAADPGIETTRTFDVASNWCLVHGWPVVSTTEGLQAKGYLAEMRRSVERFGFRHLYQDVTPFGDPNCYMKIGFLDGEPEPESDITDVRAHLAAHPFRLAIDYQDLVVVGYDDATLPPRRTVAVSLEAVATDKHAWDAFDLWSAAY
ncbi:hypothetical protein [Streptomyces sp. NPDC051576]|uniref:hypothetical protein n=1 Tax=Streptomyces sp. NPDC051576 TaxID=3155803 RepID=UPI0034236CA9